MLEASIADGRLTGIFVSYRPFAEAAIGGVQACTKEYIASIVGAGIALNFCLFDGDRRLTTRIARRLYASPYFRPAEPGIVPNVVKMAAESGASFIFLNQVSLAALAHQIKTALPHVQIILLSHGLESTDFLHTFRLRTKLPLTFRSRPCASVLLGDMLLKETRYRSSIDLVCTLSPFDADLERWLGTKRVTWLPRSVMQEPVAWAPAGDRLGFVGTLDHAPNLDGLVQVLERFKANNLGRARVRVAGGPAGHGRWLTDRYEFVDYLGTPNDEALRREAATWNLLMHPIFCMPRGCSTKLATALAWQIPIVTTAAGCRGYTWRQGKLSIADGPAEFAHECLRLLNTEEAARARADIVEIANSSPRIEDSAAALRDALDRKKEQVAKDHDCATESFS